MLRLYDYWRSSAAYRVRIALHMKGVAFEQSPVDLRAAAQRTPEHLDLNAQGLVPVLEDGDLKISQSLAMIDYLDERHPEPPFLPDDLAMRAEIRSIAQIIASDIHPLNNLRVMQYLENTLAVDQLKRMAWYHHWLSDGLGAVERIVSRLPGVFCCGDQPTLADICLVPQVYNAKRYEFDLGPFPSVRGISDRCQQLEAFAKAAPQHQPGA